MTPSAQKIFLRPLLFFLVLLLFLAVKPPAANAVENACGADPFSDLHFISEIKVKPDLIPQSSEDQQFNYSVTLSHFWHKDMGAVDDINNPPKYSWDLWIVYPGGSDFPIKTSQDGQLRQRRIYTKPYAEVTSTVSEITPFTHVARGTVILPGPSQVGTDFQVYVVDPTGNFVCVLYSNKFSVKAIADIPSAYLGNQISTSLGDIPTNAPGFATTIVRFAVGIAGGLAFLMMVFGAFRLMFSAGNPEAVQQGREIIAAAVIGLLVIVFSVFILRLIGIDILRLPI
jgi:hypothetical protein